MPTKAQIKILPNGGDLTCFFNPSEYQIARSVKWNAQYQGKYNVPKYDFGGIGDTTMNLTLFFDTSLEKEKAKKDVRKQYTDKLWKAVRVTNPGAKAKEPPKILFTWGTTWSFEAVITNINQKFILFEDDGTPIRTEVTLSLTQVKDPGSFAKQNPTSGGEPGEVYTVHEGDRLDLIAAKYYQKPMLWRYIAEHNDIDNPRQLIPGQRLFIPPLQ